MSDAGPSGAGCLLIIILIVAVSTCNTKENENNKLKERVTHLEKSLDTALEKTKQAPTIVIPTQPTNEVERK